MTESSVDHYLRHYANAERISEEAYDDSIWGEASEAIACAQVEATLALAVSACRIADQLATLVEDQ